MAIGPNDLVTSSGVLRDRLRPRVGVVSANSLDGDFLDSFWTEGVDLGYLEALSFVRNELKAGSPDATEEELNAKVEDEMEDHESNGPFVLGYRLNTDGLYEPDPDAPFSASYSPDSGVVTVEASKETTRCGHTSPCYVMSDGRGPCGDLDSDGDTVVAYTLPFSCWDDREGEA